MRTNIFTSTAKDKWQKSPLVSIPHIPNTVKNSTFYNSTLDQESQIHKAQGSTRGDGYQPKFSQRNKSSQMKTQFLSKYAAVEKLAELSNKDKEDYMEYLSNKTPMLPALGLNKVFEKQMAKEK